MSQPTRILGWRSSGLRRSLRDRARDDSGLTLVELLVASSLLVVLLTLVMISTSMLDDVSASVDGQYQEYQQTLPALVPIEKLVQAEVEPAPTAWSWDATANTQAPTPGFALIGNYGLTFYANVGMAYNNVASTAGTTTTAGPAKVVAQEKTAAGTAVTSATTCSAAAPCELQVQMYLPVVYNGISTCPGVGTGSGLNGGCSWQTTSRMIADIQDVTNSPAADQPIFSYNLLDPTMSTAFNLTATEVQSGTLSGLTDLGYPTDTQTIASCNLPSTGYPTISIACPLDAIQSVGMDLFIGTPSAGTAGADVNQVIIYRYPKSSGEINYPYQYSSLVG